jgi:peptide/nickel transport system substrate-binding protein
MVLQWVWTVMLLSTASAQTQHNPDPIKVGQTFMANSIDPVDGGSAGWALVSHGVAEKLFVVDKQGVIQPQIAQSLTKVNTYTWDITIKDDYKFSDGTLVTPAHVVTSLQLLNSNNSNAQASLGTMTVSTQGTSKVRIVGQRATPVMEAVLAEFVFVIFLQKAGGYIFTGPFKIETYSFGSYMNLVPNMYYPTLATERPLVKIMKYSNGDALATAVEANSVDLAFHLPVARLPALRTCGATCGNPTITSFAVTYQYMMWHNMRKAPLSDLNVRKAVDIALDRNALSQSLSGGDGTRSFFPSNTPWYVQDSLLGQLNGRKSDAETLLDQAGWAKNSSGQRNKNGVALTMKLVAYEQRPGLVTMQPVIAQALPGIGRIVNSVTTPGTSWAMLDDILATKDFDLLCWAQNVLQAGDPQFFINSFFRSGQGNNQAGLNSTSVDNLIDTLSNAASGTGRVTASNNAEKAILDLVPVSMLVSPAWHVSYSDRLPEYQPYGADYYIINAAFGLGAMTTTTTNAGTSGSGGTTNSVNSDTSGSYSVLVGGLPVASLWLIGSLLGV